MEKKLAVKFDHQKKAFYVLFNRGGAETKVYCERSKNGDFRFYQTRRFKVIKSVLIRNGMFVSTVQQQLELQNFGRIVSNNYATIYCSPFNRNLLLNIFCN